MNKKTSYIYVYLIVCLSFVAHLSLLYKISGAKIVDRAFQNEYRFSGDYVVVRGIPVYNELKDHSVFTVKLFKLLQDMIEYKHLYYILTNALVRTLCCISFYYFCFSLKLSSTFSLYASMIFSSHPIHCELVCDITGTSLLIGCLTFKTLLCEITKPNCKTVYLIPLIFVLLQLHQTNSLIFIVTAICIYSVSKIFDSKSLDIIVKVPIAFSFVSWFAYSYTSYSTANFCFNPLFKTLKQTLSVIKTMLVHKNFPYLQLTFEELNESVSLINIMVVALVLLLSASGKNSKVITYGLILLFAPLISSIKITSSASIVGLYVSCLGFSIVLARLLTTFEKITKVFSKFILIILILQQLRLSNIRSLEWASRESAINCTINRDFSNDSHLQYEKGKLFLNNLKEEHKSITYFKSSVQKSESEVKGKFLLSLASTYENFLKTDQEIIKVKNYYKKSIELIPKENLPRYKLAEYQSKLVFSGHADEKDVLNTVSSFQIKATEASTVLSFVKAIKLFLSSELQLKVFKIVKKSLCNGNISSCDKNFIYFLDMMPKNIEGISDIQQHYYKMNNYINCDEVYKNKSEINFVSVKRCVLQHRALNKAIHFASKLSLNSSKEALEILELVSKDIKDDFLQAGYEKLKIFQNQKNKWREIEKLSRENLIPLDWGCYYKETIWKLLVKYYDRNGQTIKAIDTNKLCLKKLNRRLKSNLIPQNEKLSLKSQISYLRLEIASRLRGLSQFLHHKNEKRQSQITWKENLIHLKKAVELDPNNLKAIKEYEKLKTMDFEKYFS